MHNIDELSIVYGPVLSWRFGRSLGIDVISGVKTCSFNCIYCQLGRTINFLANPDELRNPVSPENVLKSLKSLLERIDPKSIDVVTFSGLGEPTLNPKLEDIIKEVKKIELGKPHVILTNSSLMHIKKVRNALQNFDIVCAKLDAGDRPAFLRINRPYKEVSNLNRIINAIKEFKKTFSGKLMIQSMFLRTRDGFTNSEGEQLRHLVDKIRLIEPDVIQIDTPYRPGGEEFIEYLKVNELLNVAKEFEKYFSREVLWVFGIHDMRGRSVRWRSKKDIETSVLELLKRRPCRIFDICDSLDLSYRDAEQIVRNLISKGLVKEYKTRLDIYFKAG